VTGTDHQDDRDREQQSRPARGSRRTRARTPRSAFAAAMMPVHERRDPQKRGREHPHQRGGARAMREQQERGPREGADPAGAARAAEREQKRERKQPQDLL